MSGTATLDRHMNVAFFQVGEQVAFNIGPRTPTGGALVTGIKIFRVGSFRDSRNEQHNWTQDHLEQMVENFNLLRSNGAFPNVPWRIDHSDSALSVVGYFEKLYTVPGFLLADVLFTRPEVVDGMENGTFRSRSAEIGVYGTNDESYHWPVVVGCAFVDLPACEGLYGKAQTEHRTLLYADTQGAGMFKIDGKDVTPEEWTAAATYAQTLVDAEAVPASQHSQVVEELTKAKADLATAQGAIAAHGKGDTVEFRVEGKGTADPIAIQNHITVLETFRSESVKAGKIAYVKSLCDGKKMPATQLDSQTAFVEGLSDEQFAAYRASWDAAPENSLFGSHGTGPTNDNGTKPAGGNAAAMTELEIAVGVVESFRRSGMKEDAIAKTASFKKMTELQAQAQ